MIDYYNEMLAKRTKNLNGCCWLFLVMVLAIFLGVLFGSCKSVQYVPVEIIRTEIKEVHDTLRIRDSIKNEKKIIIREADTAEIERLNREYDLKLDKAQKTILMMLKEKESQSHTKKEVRDSIVYRDKEIQVPYPVEKKLSKWQQAKVDWGGWAMLIVVVFIFLVLFFSLRRRGVRGV